MEDNGFPNKPAGENPRVGGAVSASATPPIPPPPGDHVLPEERERILRARITFLRRSVTDRRKLVNLLWEQQRNREMLPVVSELLLLVQQAPHQEDQLHEMYLRLGAALTERSGFDRERFRDGTWNPAAGRKGATDLEAATRAFQRALDLWPQMDYEVRAGLAQRIIIHMHALGQTVDIPRLEGEVRKLHQLIKSGT